MTQATICNAFTWREGNLCPVAVIGKGKDAVHVTLRDAPLLAGGTNVKIRTGADNRWRLV
jgi:hypothetical protein